MVLQRTSGARTHHVFRELPALLRPGDLLVRNRSRVFPARLLGRRPRGGEAEILLLRQVEGGWEAFLRPARRMPPGTIVDCGQGVRVNVQSGPLADDGRRLVTIESEDRDTRAAIERAGRLPLPPYIRRPAEAGDRERYQTVYAREPGSVAAPTAGLHFTDDLIRRLGEAGIEIADVLLHVGPGTFQPVKAADVRDHRVAAEPFDIPTETAAAVARARQRGGRVVAVGTTVVRTLESAARADGTVPAGPGETSLVIIPGFDFQVVDALVTNFHLPRSSLLLLVAAFAGRESILDAYREAVERAYRFYSYGDAMLIT